MSIIYECNKCNMYILLYNEKLLWRYISVVSYKFLFCWFDFFGINIIFVIVLSIFINEILLVFGRYIKKLYVSFLLNMLFNSN